jgi:microcystin-dependent protein
MKIILSLLLLVGIVSSQAALQRGSPQMLDMAGAIIAMPVPDAQLQSWCLKPAGQVVSRTGYPRVFAKYGTTYNTGGEAGTDFRLPDWRGRTPFGDDDMGGSAANRITNGASGITGTTLGATGGAETLSAHTHDLGNHTHTISNHVHTIDHGHANTFAVASASQFYDNVFGGGVSALGLVGSTDFGDGSADHSHTLTGSVTNMTGNSGNPTTNPASGNPSSNTSGSTGTGSHANMPPAFITTWCIII